MKKMMMMMMMTLMYALSYNATPTFSAYQLQLRIIDCGDIYIKSITLCRFCRFSQQPVGFVQCCIQNTLANLSLISSSYQDDRK